MTLVALTVKPIDLGALNEHFSKHPDLLVKSPGRFSTEVSTGLRVISGPWGRNGNVELHIEFDPNRWELPQGEDLWVNSAFVCKPLFPQDGPADTSRTIPAQGKLVPHTFGAMQLLGITLSVPRRGKLSPHFEWRKKQAETASASRRRRKKRFGLKASPVTKGMGGDSKVLLE